MRLRPLFPALRLIAVAAIYFAAAELGLSMASVHTNVSPVWPPTGFAIGVVLWLGYRISPGITLGAFLANLATGVSVATAGAIAVGNTLEALCAAFLIHRFIGHHSPFDRAKDVLKFVFIAGFLSTTVSATVGNLSLCLSGAASWDNFGSLWLTWWLGDGAGALVVAPLLLTWVEKRYGRWLSQRFPEALILALLLCVTATSIFMQSFFIKGANYPLGHLTIPFLLWAAFRFGPRGAITAVNILSGIAVLATAQGVGTFARQNPNESLLLLQVFVAAMTVMALILAAVVIERRHAEEALRESENRFRQLAENINEVFWISDPHKPEMLYISPGYEQVWGRSRESLYERPASYLEAIRPDNRERVLAALQKQAGGGYTDEEYEVRRPDGSTCWVRDRAFPIRDESGKVYRIAGIAEDITERKQVEQALRSSEERFSKAFNLNPQPMSIRALDGRIMDINDGFLRLTGYTREEVIGHTATDLGMWTSKADRDAVLSMIEERRSVRDREIIFRMKNGEERVCLFSAEVITIGDEQYILVATNDITERKQAEEEREQLLAREKAARIEAEQAQKLSVELLHREQTARADAEVANRAKDQFLATISHELRTPLNAILGWAGLLRTGKLDEAGSAQGLEAVMRNAKAQAQLINDILDVSRIVTGKLRIEVCPVDLSEVVQAAVDVIRPAANAKEISLDVELNQKADPISGDPDRLQQIMWNLLSNAVKFTPKGGQVRVQLERLNSHVEISVSDTGIGISADFLPYVFERFRQADSSYTRSHSGLGLGLAIVRNLVELHGGTVEAFSDGEDRGATFKVKLPLIAPQDSEHFPTDVMESGVEKTNALANASFDRPPTLEGIRLLVVDDDSDARHLLSVMLSQCGAKVTAVATAAAALDSLERLRPDLMISDIEMPKEDGYGLINEVRSSLNESIARTPALALSAHARAEDRLRALSTGYDAHVAKPVEPAELVTVIVRLIGSQEKNSRKQE
ncbi:MAG TPA: MASE1 domain-containing protein [Blastocatellia bacterium]|nr:MASE1 domain-containing protein [Blastocatellia bacterium]